MAVESVVDCTQSKNPNLLWSAEQVVIVFVNILGKLIFCNCFSFAETENRSWLGVPCTLLC